MTIEDSKNSARGRFERVREFIRESDRLITRSSGALRVDLYSSWLLLLYAATEGAFVEYGRSSVDFMATHAGTPGSMPGGLRFMHQSRLARRISSLTLGEYEAGDAVHLIDALTSSSWGKYTNILTLDGNVWPDRVVEWFGRIGVAAKRLEWLEEPFGTSSETRRSRLRALVAERNSIAHGTDPTTIASAEVMLAWVDEIDSVAELAGSTLQCGLAEQFPTCLVEAIGLLDPNVADLAEETLAFAHLRAAVCVGDSFLHLVSPGDSVGVRLRTVKSIQNDGREMGSAPAGTERVAISFNGDVANGAVFPLI